MDVEACPLTTLAKKIQIALPANALKSKMRYDVFAMCEIALPTRAKYESENIPNSRTNTTMSKKRHAHLRISNCKNLKRARNCYRDFSQNPLFDWMRVSAVIYHSNVSLISKKNLKH